MSNKVSVLESGKKNYPWYVSYPDGGTRKKKYFKKKERKGGADEWATKTRKELAKKGNEQASITPTELRAVHMFREALGKLPDHAQTITMVDAVETFIKGLEIRHQSITCQDVADKLLAKLFTEGAGKRHRDTMENRLKRFNQDYGDWLACDISTEVIDDFLSHLKIGQQTKLHYRRAIGQMFNFAVEKNAAPFNPVTKAIKPKVKPAATEILKPGQVADLLSHADDDTLPGLAISFFAGVRRAELERLDWSEIDLDEGFIEIKAAKAKTAQRRLIPISDNLKEWLLPHEKHEGLVCISHSKWRTGQEKARSDAKITEWPHNAGRHSFASFHLAMNDDPGKLAMELGHPDPRLLFQHYRQLVTKKAAKTYWSIQPAKPADEEKVTNIKKSA